MVWELVAGYSALSAKNMRVTRPLRPVPAARRAFKSLKLSGLLPLPAQSQKSESTKVSNAHIMAMLTANGDLDPTPLQMPGLRGCLSTWINTL